MLKIYKKTIRNKKSILVNESQYSKGSFVYSINPNEDEIEFLTSKLGIDNSLILDSLDPYEVPRLEEDNKITFVISSFPVKETGRLIGIPFALVIGEGFVAITSMQPLHFLENWFENGDDFVTTQKTKIINLIFKKLMEEYNSQLLIINKEVHRISLSLGKIASDDITKLASFEESLNIIFGDLVPTDVILRKILSGKKMILYGHDKESIEDTVLYTEQLIDMIKSNLMKISNLRNVYSTILTDNLNNTMKFLAAITVILTLPTIVGSIYGMNVNLPFANHPLIFVFIILFIILCTLALIYFFIKNKWF